MQWVAPLDCTRHCYCFQVCALLCGRGKAARLRWLIYDKNNVFVEIEKYDVNVKKIVFTRKSVKTIKSKNRAALLADALS